MVYSSCILLNPQKHVKETLFWILLFHNFGLLLLYVSYYFWANHSCYNSFSLYWMHQLSYVCIDNSSSFKYASKYMCAVAYKLLPSLSVKAKCHFAAARQPSQCVVFYSWSKKAIMSLMLRGIKVPVTKHNYHSEMEKQDSERKAGSVWPQRHMWNTPEYIEF